MMSANLFFIFCIFLAFTEVVVGAKNEDDAHNDIEKYNIAFEKNYEWIEKIKTKDKNLLGFVESIKLKYEIRDIIAFLKTITDKMREYNFGNFKDETLKRQFKLILETNYYNLTMEETFVVAEAIDRWNDEFIDADEEKPTTYCQYKDKTNCKLSLSDVFDIITNSNDVQELKWCFAQLLDRDAEKRDKKYIEFLELFNKAAKSNGFLNAFQMLIAPYEDENIEEKIEKTKIELMNFYELIRLDLFNVLQSSKNNYELTTTDKLIPEYLWWKTVQKVYDPNANIKYPYENDGNSDYNALIKGKVNSSVVIYEMAKEFFKSLGLDTEKMKYKLVLNNNGHSTKFDDKFGRREIKLRLSPAINERSFLQTYMQMLYMVQYQYSYKQQPYPLRKLRPRAFSLALGNAIALSVQSPTYWHKIGFVDKSGLSLSHLINRLYKFSYMLLLPLQNHYVIADTMKCLQEKHLNDTTKCNYWNNKKAIQGVILDGRTSDLEVLFTKHNPINNDDYEDIFSILVGFQIYEGLCKKIGQYSDEKEEKYLAQCDLSDSKEVGKILSEILADGGSKPWQEHFRKLSDDVDISAKSLLKYFKPLEQYLSDKK